MPKLKCRFCDKVFEGEDATYEIREHLFECAVEEIKTEKDDELITKLLQTYPHIDNIKIKLYDDFDTNDMMIINRKDGTNYRIVYRDKDIGFLSWETKGKESDAFESACHQIDAIENKIVNVITTVKEHVPEADIRFHSIYENTGTLGNGYDFTFTADGKERTVRMFGNGVKRFAEEVKAYYVKEVNGTLTKFNDQYTIDGVNINEWLLINKEKNVSLKVND